MNKDNPVWDWGAFFHLLFEADMYAVGKCTGISVCTLLRARRNEKEMEVKTSNKFFF